MASNAVHMFRQPLIEKYENPSYRWFILSDEIGLPIVLRTSRGLLLTKSLSPRLSSLFHSVKSVRVFDPQLSIMMERLRTMQLLPRSGGWTIHNYMHKVARGLLSSRAAASHPRTVELSNVLQGYPCGDRDDRAVPTTSQKHRRLRRFLLARTPRSHPLAIAEALFYVRPRNGASERSNSVGGRRRKILIRLMLFLSSDLSSFSLALSCAIESLVASLHERPGYFPLRPVEALSNFEKMCTRDSTFLRMMSMEELRGIQGGIDHAIRAMERVNSLQEQGTLKSCMELVSHVMDKKGGKKVCETPELLEMILLKVEDEYRLLCARGVSRLWRETIDTTASLQRRLFLAQPILTETSLSSEIDSGSWHLVSSLLGRSSTTFGNYLTNDIKSVVIPWCLLRQPVDEIAMCRRMFLIYPPVTEFILEPRGRPSTVLRNPEGIRFGEALDSMRPFWLKQSERHVRKDTGSRYKEKFSRKRTRIERVFADMVLPEDLHGTQESARCSWDSDLHVGLTRSNHFTPQDYPFSGSTRKRSPTTPPAELLSSPHHPFDLSWMRARRASAW